MEKVKRIVIANVLAFIVSILFLGLLYLLGCFVVVSFDISDWDRQGRSLFVALGVIGILCSFGVANQLAIDNEN